MKPTTLFHLLFFFAFFFICWQDYLIVSGDLLPIPGWFLSKFVWLTLINLYMQTFYHFLGIFVSRSKMNSQVFDYLGRTFSGPIGVTVAFLFWPLYLADPNTLANDERGRQILAITWFNHGLHTLPLVSAILDHIIWNHYEFQLKNIIKGFAYFISFYLLDVHFVYFTTGFWAYPILGELTFPFRILFFAGCTVVIFISYLFLSLVHKVVHSNSYNYKAQPKKNKSKPN